jgi:hypothetical protein
MHMEVAKYIDEALYKDIIEEGGLSKALESLLANANSSLKPKVVGFACVTVRSNQRSSQVMLAAEERLFSVDFWCKGVCYGSWWINSLEIAALSIRDFIEDEYDCMKMHKSYHWFKSTIGMLHEKDASLLVKRAWKSLLRRLERQKSAKRNTLIRTMYGVARIAHQNKHLRVLMPYISMETLCFSLTTGWPYKTIGPKITSLQSGTCVLQTENGVIQGEVHLRELSAALNGVAVAHGKAYHGTADTA